MDINEDEVAQARVIEQRHQLASMTYNMVVLSYRRQRDAGTDGDCLGEMSLSAALVDRWMMLVTEEMPSDEMGDGE